MKNNEPLLPLPEVATMQPTVEDILRKRNSELEAQLAEIRQVTKEILEGESNFDALEQAVNKAHGNKHECEGLERDKVIAQLQNRIAELEAKPCLTRQWLRRRRRIRCSTKHI